MVQVIKADGTKEAFDEIHVISSIRRAGIPKELVDEVLTHVESKLYENIPTFEIYHHIVEYLGKSKYPYARAKYSLKQAIMLLGPTGYPFEDFVAKLLEEEGYTVAVRQILTGKCISHEVDVVAKKGSKSILVEVKFHNSVGIRSDVHVPMYTKSRFDDVKEKYNLSESWIVTNTKTTVDANIFAHCAGMQIVSWDYPHEWSLRDRIEKNNLHPITMLTSLTPARKLILLNNHIVLCKDLHNNEKALQLLGLSPDEKNKVNAELSFIS